MSAKWSSWILLTTTFLLASCSLVVTPKTPSPDPTGSVADADAIPEASDESIAGLTSSSTAPAPLSLKSAVKAPPKPTLPTRTSYSKPSDPALLRAQEAWDVAAGNYSFNVFIVKDSKKTAAARVVAEAALAAWVAESKKPTPSAVPTLTHAGTGAATLVYGPSAMAMNLYEGGAAQRVDFVVDGVTFTARDDVLTMPEVDGTYTVAITSYSQAGEPKVWPRFKLTRLNGNWAHSAD